jgi:pimeloyl-ACP methyl ester carboxylesterase
LLGKEEEVDWRAAAAFGPRMVGMARSAAGEAWSWGRAAAGYRDADHSIFGATQEWDDAPGFTTPVVLVHGAGHNHSAWGALTRRLRAAGFARLVAFEYRVGPPIEQLAETLGEHIERVAERAESARVHVVGHSLGGLALRVWHDLQGGDERVFAAASLGSPQRPLPLARVPWTPPSLRALAPGSALHRELARADTDHHRWTTIAGGIDHLVPPRFASLDGADAQVLRHLGHMGLLYSRTAAGHVCFSLLAAEEESAAMEVA